MRSRRFAARVLGTAALLAIVVLTLGPESPTCDRPPFWCMSCGQLDLLDSALNVALFVPLGVALALGSVSRARAAFVCFAVSLTVELLQYNIPGREPSARDILTNTAGGLVGAWLVRRGPALLLPSRRRAAALVVLSAGAAAMVSVAGAWLLRPLPPWGAWYNARTAPRHNEPPHFAGRVVTAALQPNGRAVPPNAELDAVIVLDKLQPSRALVLVFENADEDEAYALMVRGRDLLVRRRLRAASVRLRNPAVVLRDMLPERAGPRDTLHVHISFSGATLTATVAAHGLTVRRARRIAPWLGWAVVAPFDWNIGDSALPTAAWIATLLLAPGYFTLVSLRRGLAWMRRAIA